MGEFQTDTIRAMLPPDTSVSDAEIAMVANAWMIAGILGISSLTISLNSMFVAISDRERGLLMILPLHLSALLISHSVILLVPLSLHSFYRSSS